MTIRTERVGNAIRKEVASMLTRGEIKDPRLGGFVNIQEVRVSPDLSYAKVYYTVFGESDQAGVADAWQRASGFLRNVIAKRLKLRHAPELRFELDHVADYSKRIDELLNGLEIPPADDSDETH
ncbi:ribosome-binding factor A [Magnetococcus marinus MC-1]|uniref:Ribosome-binding factor A n=1 Tax=Magnetococcus marinus (strain ATCC BAA-1437 / JCM 17883 / MC-1) TaxID=156889 RepID=RBFA_MAGMM|nr:30S ribosome-binding factor RbfA [Magnetococcus marinus]A0LE17.1 RecName: Full=Ribosome-binding factor A [Magnetococcus marinus MC-1]ABK46210.1 ribosome-binding factor A [Magnetococcus marinus MC-1]